MAIDVPAIVAAIVVTHFQKRTIVDQMNGSSHIVHYMHQRQESLLRKSSKFCILGPVPRGGSSHYSTMLPRGAAASRESIVFVISASHRTAFRAKQCIEALRICAANFIRGTNPFFFFLMRMHFRQQSIDLIERYRQHAVSITHHQITGLH